jgi:site-specific DNA-methyltransferase (adenine-specific)
VIITGDARELGKDVPDQSVDLIFTDPPYLKEYLPLYYWLFEYAARVLKPSGFLMTYVGGYWKNIIMASADKHLDYFWDYVSWERGDSPMIWPRKTLTRCKSILCYRPKGGTGMPRTNVLGMWVAGGDDKRYHSWGQDESTARYYIDCFCGPGDMVHDPFTGGGTTLAMAKMLGRKYLGFEIDDASAQVARARVNITQLYVVFDDAKQGVMPI